MKTRTIGMTTYMVTKYFINNEGILDVVISKWSKAENAFADCENHRKKHGEDMAHVFKAKQCVREE